MLKKIKLTLCKEEPCIFIDKRQKLIVIFYIDDVLVLYHRNNKEKAIALIAKLNKAYKLRPLGDIKWFLGI